MTSPDDVADPVPDPTDEELAPLDEVVVDVDEDVPDESTPTADQALRYYGVDFDVEGLARRFRRKDLVVPTFDPAADGDLNVEGFQRRFVWPKKQMDRFIESLLLGYPVPGIFLVEQPDRTFLVLDGQQRLRTLDAFYEGTYVSAGKERIFRLDFVANDFRGLTYKTLSDADRRLLDSTIIQSTVVVPKGKDLEAVYRVFERINSSGIKLQPQEIRVALYSGPAIRMLRDLNSLEAWRALFGPRHSRLKDHELILRYLGLLESAEALIASAWNRDEARRTFGAAVYRPAMTSFLNQYLDRHRNLEDLDERRIRGEFAGIVQSLAEARGRDTLRFNGTQVNAAHSDAVLVGATLAFRKHGELSAGAAADAIGELMTDDEYESAVVESTSHLDSVMTRLRISIETFERYAAS